MQSIGPVFEHTSPHAVLIVPGDWAMSKSRVNREFHTLILANYDHQSLIRGSLRSASRYLATN